MSLFVLLVTFGLVGAIIGAIAMIPLRRWWHNRRYAGCVEVWGVNTATGNWERHLVRPGADTLPFTMNDGSDVEAPINGAAGGQLGNRRCYLIDLATQTQLWVGPDNEPRRLSGKWFRDIARKALIPQIDSTQNGRGPSVDRNLILMMIAVLAISVLGFIINGVMINNVDDARQTVGTVVRP